MAKRINLKEAIVAEYEEIFEILRNDGLIIFPTETIYGFGCDYRSKVAIEKLLKVKK